MGSDSVELVFIPVPQMGHIMSTVEIAKLLLDRHPRLSVTVLNMRLPTNSDVTAGLESLAVSLSGRPIRFVTLPSDEQSVSRLMSTGNPINFLTAFIDLHKPQVRDAVAARLAEPDSGRLAGLVINMFCTSMIDVADEFGLPTYVFFASGAAFLGLMLHVQDLNDEHGQDPTEFKDSDAELAVPSFGYPVPARVLPSVVVEKDAVSEMILKHARGFRRARGMLVNTFEELESHAVASFSETFPTLYPVGPILHPEGAGDKSRRQEDGKAAAILAWLDEQPPRSVVFLCFGSMGSFRAPQVQEIARGLEGSGHRFLWSLRRPPPKGEIRQPTEYEDVSQVLPDGFSERTAAIGRVIGWAPQAAVLSHPSVGGFVSHCGWNSTLESLWFGVPIATWPMYAEQQANAFLLTRELGLAVELTLDYRKDSDLTIDANEVERGIRCVMEQDSEVRKRVAKMSEASRKAMAEGGSSYASLGQFIKDAIDRTLP